VSGRGLVAAVTAFLALGGVCACATQVSGRGTGAGPHNGIPDASTPAASTSAPATASSSSHPAPSTSAPSTAAVSSGSVAATHPVPSQPLRVVRAVGGDGTNYVVKVWAVEQTTDCAAHAYGTQVIDFLRRHPCTGMSSLIATTTVNGRAVGFAQRAIGFRGAEHSSYRTAGQFRQLVNRSGTGNLNDLLREGYRLPQGPGRLPFPNAFNTQGQDNSVSVVEAWYLHGATPDNDRPLEKMEDDIFLQVH
jgi:hypothetical protein